MQIPFAVVAVAKRFVVEHPCRANFNQITTEIAVQTAVFMTTKIDIFTAAQYHQIVATGIILVKTYTAIATDIAIHFMAHTEAEILIIIGFFAPL